jgi:nitrite reductase (NADH) large subunit
MISFMAVTLLGAASGGITALEHRLGAATGARARRLTLWLHILACWPLPALLGFHILTVYYF